MSTVKVEVHRFADDGRIPNNPKLPALIYRRAIALSGSEPAATVENIFAANHWSNSWRNGVYPFHHYHSNTHEVLGVYQGHAKVQLGGEQGAIVEIRAGDVVLLPAGTGHRKDSASDDFSVVGAYPNGADWDLCRGDKIDRPHAERKIAQVPMPDRDPVYGQTGPLFEYWK
jgi:uncharacterized protein YjlB